MKMSMISKQLTKSDIEKSLLMPADSFGSFPLPFEGDRFFNVTTVDGTGKAWDIPCFVQQSEGIVSVDWLRFLSGKDVRAGDTVFLHRKPMDDGGGDLTASAKLKIEVKRKIRLMGEDIWAVLQ
ncbi:hypothetical protein Goshw_030065 [Gossypium schwendimanii]|uniref:TF-B3 domain-containing protein n=1 Tax=Gossypium schwendimanii TaxID=34291 RepID=A0A7J9LCW2_GOSSC|nr:hypothetical protein [Gossypium schwendimanii]